MSTYLQISESYLFKKNMIKAFTVASCIMFSSLAYAGKITSQATDNEASTPGFSGFNQENISVLLNGEGSWYEPSTGSYYFAEGSDFTYEAIVKNSAGIIMGKMLAKDWPVGEPSGIKIVNDDFDVNKKKASNCIMSTSYLEDHYLDSDIPIQVICSSPYQTHKRYKLAMLPATVESAEDVEDGVDEEDAVGAKGVDLVFNVEEELELDSRDYQVFQKINNWTDTRLQGFTIQLGFGVGENFIGIKDQYEKDENEVYVVDENGLYQCVEDAVPCVQIADLNLTVPRDIWDEKQLATFSAGLFGPEDKHTGETGFFDDKTRAGFLIDEYVAADPDAIVDPELSELLDTLHATITLGSKYSALFGPWLPNSMLPWGIFFDDDNDPSTDDQLIAWYGAVPTGLTYPNAEPEDLGGLAWRKGIDDYFAPIPDVEIVAMSNNPIYSTGEIDDLVNVGLNYNVTIGDISLFPGYDADSGQNAATFTIRITPTKEFSVTPPPSFMGIVDGVLVAVEPDPVFIFLSKDAVVEIQPEPTFYVGDFLTARVADVDLNTASDAIDTVTVTISTSSGLSDDAFTLTEQGPNRGIFSAILPDEFSNVPVDTAVTLTYIDQEGGSVANENKTSSTTAYAASVFDFESATYQVLEGDGTVEIIVLREGTLGEIVAVDYSTVSGTATGNEDYEPAASRLIFESGEDTKTIEIVIFDDEVDEASELFSVLLSNTSNGAFLGNYYIASVIIEDDISVIDVDIPLTEDEPSEANVVSSSGGSMTMWYLLLMALLISMRKIVKK
jgi:hypothetical protein